MSKARKRVAIIGSHGIYASYGGWDQLVNNLAERRSEDVEYVIFNSRESPRSIQGPPGVTVRRLPFSAAGFEGLFFDFYSVLLSLWRVDVVLLLGVQGIPLLAALRWLWPVRIVSNVGGVEWERPHLGQAARLYLRFCFDLALRFSTHVVLDNPHYRIYLPQKHRANVVTIPYGGVIDTSLRVSEEMLKKFPFLDGPYFLAVGRSIADNRLRELCEAFSASQHRLVLISNLSRSAYGRAIFADFSNRPGLTLIDGLYDKPELDLIRRRCTAYVHTQTLCGTAPSLVEMIVARRPILSADVPQNRYTLDGQGFFFSDYAELINLLDQKFIELPRWTPTAAVRERYDWAGIVNRYEGLYR